jgi:hypothetical protein
MVVSIGADSVDSMIAASSNSVRTISRREATIPALVNDG